MASAGCSEPRTIEDIGHDIRMWVKSSKDWTIASLAEELAISDSSVKRIYNGEAELTSTQIAILCEIMDKDVSFFIPTVNHVNERERAYRRMEQYASKGNELEERGKTAMGKINRVKSMFKREHFIKQVESIAETATWEK